MTHSPVVRRAGSLTAVVVGTGAALLALGCGPSMRNLVEADMRFEHCYRIDDDPKAPVADKKRCWQEWTARYDRGQDRSRIAYAHERLRALDCTGDALAMASAGPSPASCPPPDSPYAPPPSVAEPKGAVVKGESSSLQAKSVGAACTGTCTEQWRACIAPCGSGAGCVVECDVRFKDCVKTCL